MRQHGTTAVALEFPAEPWTEGHRARERDKAADRVHDSRTGEVVETGAQRRQKVSRSSHGGEETVRSPGPVTDDWIDKSRYRHAIKQVADETRAPDHRARGDGRAGIGKSKLEQPKGQERHARRLIGNGCTLQEEPVVTNKAVAVAEHEGKSEGEEEQAAKARIDDAFHQHVDC